MYEKAICIENLTKEFGDVKAVNGISLEIPTGVIFGFLGPNGAGKTTMIRLLLGLLDPTSGRATVLGYDSRTHADLVRANCGALLEHSGIYEQMSAEDNLEFYGRAFQMPMNKRKVRIQELLNRMGLWERRKNRAGNWSRGMKQKLALARTLLHQPRLILLDEPTAGLDVQASVAVREDLESLVSGENVTIFLTTHNMADVEKLCDQVAVVKDGNLIAHATPEELRARNGVPRVEILGHGFNQKALAMVKAYPQVSTVTKENNHLVIELHANMEVYPLVSSLVTAGAHIEEVRREKASLEEVFLSLTGDKDV